jgi:hypothetical protein
MTNDLAGQRYCNIENIIPTRGSAIRCRRQPLDGRQLIASAQ